MWDDEKRMSFTEHLGELRDRIIKAGIFLLVAVVVCYFFSNQIFDIIAGPLLVDDEGVRVMVLGEEGVERQNFVKALESEGYEVEVVAAYGNGEERVAVLQALERGQHNVLLTGAILGDKTAVDLMGLLKERGLDVEVLVICSDEHLAIAQASVSEGAFGFLPQPVTGSNLRLSARDAVAESDKKSRKVVSIPWIALDPLEGILVKVKLAVAAGLLLSFPYILWHICGFIFPGLRPKEQKAIQIGIVGCGILATTGVCFAYFGIIPVVLPFIMEWMPEDVEQKFQLSKTIVIIIKGLLVFGIVFQFPMVVLILVYLGLLTPEALRSHRRIAIVGLAFGAAIFTPPDPQTMILMMIPLLVLYEFSIWMSYLVVWSRRKKTENEEG